MNNRLYCLPLLALLASGCSVLTQVARPHVVDVAPRITRADTKGVDMAFDLKVDNPYPMAVVSKKLVYAIEIQDQELVSSEAGGEMTLKGGAASTVTLPAHIAFEKVKAIGKNLASANEADYKIHGTATVLAFGREVPVPFSHEGTLPIVRAPKFSEIKPKVTRSGLADFSLDVAAKITNPNVFKIDVSDLKYSLLLGGAELASLQASTAGEVGPGETKPFQLTGKLSATQALGEILKSGKLEGAKIVSSGTFKTPYGSVKSQ